MVTSTDWEPRCFHKFISGYRSEEFASFLKLVVGPQLKKITVDKVNILYIGVLFAASKTLFSAAYLKIPDIWSRVHTALGLLHPDWKEEIQDTKGTGRKDMQKDQKEDGSRINPLQTDWNYLSAIKKSWNIIFPPCDQFTHVVKRETATISPLWSRIREAPIVVASYYLLGLPFAWLMAWPCHLSTLGLALGGLLGTAANFMAFALLLARTQWPSMAQLAQQRSGSKVRGSGGRSLLEGDAWWNTKRKKAMRVGLVDWKVECLMLRLFFKKNLDILPFLYIYI